MALLDRLKRAVRLGRGDGPNGAASPAYQGAAIASPWAGTNELSRVITADILGDYDLAVTREQAMRIPSVAKARGLIVGLSRFPLVAYNDDNELSRQPPWLSRTDTGQAPQWRMAWTIDDLYFYGRSLWAISRGSRRGNAPGPIRDALRVPFDDWEINDNLEILVGDRDEPVGADEVIYFDGPQDALLDIARDDIRAARDMSRAWGKRVKSPVPLVGLHDTLDVDIKDSERVALIAEWEKARYEGGTAYIPQRFNVETYGDAPTDLFVAGRNASRIDFANYTNLPASMLDGSPSTSSLTYTTREGNRVEYVDISLAYWSAPIAARLSMDDVTPRGTRIDFDIRWISQRDEQPKTANPPTED